MNQKKNKKRSEEKIKPQLPGDKEDFNTGSLTPSSLRNVGAGYDDTGMGNNPNASDNNDKNVEKGKAKKESRQD